MTEADIPSYEDMVKSGMHFGRKKSVFNPKMKPFVYTARDNIYLIDLVKTRESLGSAMEFLKKSLDEGKLILFVGLSAQSADLVKDLAESLNMPYVISRWLGGTLTNFKTIISRVNHLESMEKEMSLGGFEKYTKKERLMKEKEMAKLRKKFDGLRKLTRVPDVLFVASSRESDLVLKEAKNTKVKTVGMVNTESDPMVLNYPIPANDNARRSIELIITTLKSYLKKE
ncbi:MAG: 30S ribosomal protein S2 [Candidatus Yanofskybacteria bacterium RIFCSPLOWO2_02_FULL_43_10b]|uniref:Small ribosomal subunit protein uS2 n=1 Tax=Candidatus Yanofskybacteria bacterium RIFCSPLOWO2_02_FULL_43_10b TaxID=1802704 RepID=A0A1F8H3Q7_9BACT|nr:MAG: 30S ribosomal protein S2 [Candidatus Yanofskybacteria bacterium RIFCSPLOWO2_02_FULL_43_10b]